MKYRERVDVLGKELTRTVIGADTEEDEARKRYGQWKKKKNDETRGRIKYYGSLKYLYSRGNLSSRLGSWTILRLIVCLIPRLCLLRWYAFTMNRTIVSVLYPDHNKRVSDNLLTVYVWWIVEGRMVVGWSLSSSQGRRLDVWDLRRLDRYCRVP